MVLWEITLATAYCLGLRRTYRLALRLQRRLLPSRYERLRGFIHRRTRNVFDVALTVHKNIQKRDLAAGKSVGNFILRVLDRMRPSARISGAHENNCKAKPLSNISKTGNGRNMSSLNGKQGEGNSRSIDHKLFVAVPVDGAQHSFIKGGRINVKPGIWISKAGSWQPTIAAPSNFHHCSYTSAVLPFPSLSTHAWLKFSCSRQGIFREDIAQWMRR